MPELRIGVLAIQGGFEAHVRMLRGLGADAREVRVAADLEGLDGLVIPGGESTTIVKGIEPAGLEAADPRPPRGRAAGPRHLRRDDRLRRRPPRPDRRDRAAQRLRPPAAELRGRPRGRGDRRRAAARGLHPRPLGRAPSAPGSRCSPPTTATRSRSARAAVLASAFHPELTDDSAAARAVHGDDDRSARSARTRRRRGERPEG